VDDELKACEDFGIERLDDCTGRAGTARSPGSSKGLVELALSPYETGETEVGENFSSEGKLLIASSEAIALIGPRESAWELCRFVFILEVM